MRGSRAIDRPGEVGFAFGAVDRGVSGEVYHQIGSRSSHDGGDHSGFGYVGRVAVESDEREWRGPGGAANLMPDLAARAKDQDFHKCFLPGRFVLEYPAVCEELVEIIDGVGEAVLVR